MKEAEKKRRIGDNWLILCVMSVVLFNIGGLIGGLIMGVIQALMLNISPALTESDEWITGFFYISFIGVWIVVFAYAAIFRKDRYLLKMASPKVAGNTVKHAVIGLLIGFALNGACVLAASLNGDIALEFNELAPIAFIIIFICVFIQCAAEELIYRGYLYHKLMGSYHKLIPAMLLNALMFSAGHLLNPGVTVLSLCNILLMGVLCTLPMCYMKNGIWCAFGMHTAWNFSQSILFGLPNSGNVVPYSVFRLDAGAAENSFAYNVGFGVEGTLLASLLIAIVIAVWVFYANKKNIRPTALADIVENPQEMAKTM